jgi:transposase-like protein
MNIALILLISLYLILAPVVDGSCPELVWQGERRVVKYQLSRLTANQLIDCLHWQQRFKRVVHWLLVLLLLGLSLTDDHSYVLVILGFDLFDGERFELAPRLEAYKRGDKLIINYLAPTRLELDVTDVSSLEAEIVRLCGLKTISGQKYVTQQQIGQLFGVSRQMINRRKQLVQRHDLLTLLKGDYATEVLRAEVKQRIMELVVSNWSRSDEQIANTLIEEGWVNKISVGSVQNAIKQMDGCKVRKLMRQMIGKGNFQGNIFSSSYLSDRLFELLDRVMSQLGEQSHPYLEQYQNLQTFSTDYLKVSATHHNAEPVEKTKYQRDQAYHRVNLARDQKRRKQALLNIVYGDWQAHGQGQREIICPDCNRDHVDYIFKRDRQFRDQQGVKHRGDLAWIYRCDNPDCTTKYFTALPPGLELWARYVTKAKRKGLKLVFHVRGSLRRSTDYLSSEPGITISWSCLFNWIRKAGAECPLFEDIFPLSWSKRLIVDEKYIKLYNKWIYLYVAVDEQSGEPLHLQVMPHKGADSAHLFLLQLKALGYYPDTIVTDLCPDYPAIVTKVFPKAYHHQCVFHAERAAKRLVDNYLSDQQHNADKQNLKKQIRTVFKQRKATDLKAVYEKLMRSRTDYPNDASPVFDMLHGYYPMLLKCITDHNIPKTSNAVENLIKEFDLNYRTTMGYSSIEAIREFAKAYLVYLRLCPKNEGNSKGFSPAQLARDKKIPISWDEFILAV